jgi:tRNA threonylcarbamoyladenosine biosynthesis protein TsaE
VAESAPGPGPVRSSVTGELVLETAEDTRDWGVRLGRLLTAGDLVLLTGELGAGKTTLTQGVGEGLGVRGPITSPTFVIARVHPSLVGGPELVHVDAYRLGGTEELDDLDLDTAIEAAVTVVEWGEGIAEELSPNLLSITLRGLGERSVRLEARGPRWCTPQAREQLVELVSLT